MTEPTNQTEHGQDKNYWLDRPKSVRWVYRGLWITCGLLAVADLFYHKHVVLKIEDMPAIYGIYGFICFFGIVIAGKYLRKLVGRKEDYYDR